MKIFLQTILSLKTKHFIMSGLMLLLSANVSNAQQPAFPGAEGFGKYTVGGRGGVVYEVTNLNDSGPGSLRAAVEASGPRTVVFRVSGDIILESRLNIRNPYITIAGQTAPGDGICLRKNSLQVLADEVIIRHIRVRLGDENTAQEDDALGGQSCKNVIIDHVSVSWSIDETLSIYNGVENLTVQWCIISESLHNSHHEKGAHGYGGIWGGKNTTWHHNLLAHHYSRLPRWDRGVGPCDFRNNVIYNWGGNSTYGGEAGSNGPSQINMVSNYYKSGPATSSSKRNRIVEPYMNEFGWGLWYIDNNYVHGSPETTDDNWKYGVQGVSDEVKNQISVDSPFDFEPIAEQLPEDAYEFVLNGAGAIYPKQDIIDSRIIDETRNGYATYGGEYGANSGIIDSQDDVGGYPELNTGIAPDDNDHDGMADAWELGNGLDPTDPEDRNGDFNGDGYTNLEKYINSLSEFTEFIVAPVLTEVNLIDFTEVELRWEDNSDNEEAFIIERTESDEFIRVGEVEADVTSFIDSSPAELTEYTYRIKAVAEDLEPGYSNVKVVTTSSAAAPPLQASNPYPRDGEGSAGISVVLLWEAGLGTESHNIYLGMSNPPEFVATSNVEEYAPSGLEKGTTYYWRIDEVNSNGVTEGEVWSFTTERDLSAGLVSYWNFDENGGSDIGDKGPYQLNGVIEGIGESAWVDGVSNSALDFNSSGGHAVVPHHEAIDFAGESFSISMWCKIDHTPANSMYLIHKGSFGAVPAEGKSGKWYGIEMKNNELRFAVDDDDAKSMIRFDNIDDYTLNGWTHIVVIRDSAAEELRVHVNSDNVLSVLENTGSISQEEPLYIGNSSSLNEHFEGIIDDVQIYDVVLSPDEIEQIFTQFVTEIEEGIIPETYDLRLSNYPNPFNPSTTVNYTIPHSSRVKLEIYNTLGQKINTLVDEYQSAGSYVADFNASGLGSGILIYTLTTEYGIKTNKMMLLK